MISKKAIIKSESGLHARPASLFVEEAMKYKSNIYVLKDGRQVSAKSIINILSMGAERGQEITISAEGEDEKIAVQALTALAESDID